MVGNKSSIYCNGNAVVTQDYYNVVFDGTTVTLTPTTSVSGYIDYLEF